MSSVKKKTVGIFICSELNLDLDLTPSQRHSVRGWGLNDGGIVVAVRQMEPAMVMVPPDE